MKILILVSVLINLILLLTCALGSYFLLKKDLQPHSRARLATVIIFLLFLYSLLISFIFVLGLYFKDMLKICSVIFVILPFVFGHLVKYETLKKYSVFQIVSLGISLIYLIILVYN